MHDAIVFKQLLLNTAEFISKVFIENILESVDQQATIICSISLLKYTKRVKRKLVTLCRQFLLTKQIQNVSSKLNRLFRLIYLFEFTL